MSCNETKSSWKIVEDVWSPNSFMEDNIKIFKRPGANYIAYKINRNAINSNEIIYENEYKPLENSFGIYFLYKRENIQDKKKYKTVTHIYVGRTSGSSSTGGMKRLVQHVLNDELDGKSYADKWDKALFVCLADDTGFNLGEIAAIEQVFIELFRGLDKNTNYPDSPVSIICHNRKVGDRNNTPVQDYKAHVEAIEDLLINDSIGMIHPDIKGVYISETNSALSQSVSNEVYELQDALDKATRQLEEQNIELEQYRNGSRKKFGLLDIKKLENEFKASYFKALDTYKENLPNIENNRVYTQADLIYGKKSQEVTTPMWIAKDMTKLIPDEDITEDTKFLCIYSKDEAFPNALLRRLVYNLSDKSPLYHTMSHVERLRHFIGEQLYIIVPNSECYNNTMYKLMGSLPSRFEYSDGGIGPLDPNWKEHIENFVTPHIVEIHNMQTLVKSTAGVKYIQERIEEEFKTVKFDVVIGNPPYNNDLYLDFVFLGYKLSSKYVCMITPAKWQAKGGIKNETFREEIVPHMSKIVYYKDCKDIFDIAEPDGITYYLANKNDQDTHEINYICSKNAIFNTGIEHKYCTDNVLIPKNICNIIDKVNSNKGLSDIMCYITAMSLADYGKDTYSEGDISIVCGDKGFSGYSQCNKLTLEQKNKFKCYIHCMTSSGSGSLFDSSGNAIGGGKKRTFIAGHNEVPQGHYKILKMFNTLDESKSFVSFCDSKLVSFLYFVGLSASMDVIENWRFVPAPDAFDHIFTDDELYKKYNLTPEEINIIESVIKERKQK